MKVTIFVLLFATSAYSQFPNGRSLERPIPEMCAERTIHETSPFGQNYFYSWRENIDEEDWLGSRNICRMRCMDAVSLDTKHENEWIKEKIKNENVAEIWTSGRICDFKGCDRPDLLPKDINGWFWTAIFKKMAPTTDREANDWSSTGGLGFQQPDNRESIYGKTENCLAVLNNVYNDGIRWHDEVCTRRRHYICEDSEELLRYVRYIRPDLNIK
ncbi:unnamed protein product [Ceutorhynchus assimilis]|uniref:C-type lectin domain-containing protein n=1 Tax=Ceutorhynchus assimilis TaxID=467358 RepID=A0A9N9QQX0_9CUCU|nr:unnamed protein product [Ceutorhynchus assimilis]